VALVVGTESMTRNPIARSSTAPASSWARPVGFKDYMWEALKDPAAGINMIQTAENLAKKYGITREEVDAFAAESFAKAVAAQQAAFWPARSCPWSPRVRAGRLQAARHPPAGQDHRGGARHAPALSPIEVLAKLKPVFEGGVQTGGNSVRAGRCRGRRRGGLGRMYAKAQGKKPLARVVAAAAVGVPPEIMGIGPAPAIRLLLERTGLKLDDIGRFEINEAQGAQTLAVGKELGLDLGKLNVNGGAIALGHPLACHRRAPDDHRGARDAARGPEVRHQLGLRGRRPRHCPAAGKPSRPEIRNFE
jgi:acetyl-CoA C-acetyltransferase